jgi:Cu+-exporting ATPase
MNSRDDSQHHDCCSQERKVAMLVKDPVCGMDVDPATAQHKSEYQGQTYYFCAPGCKAKFDQNPQQYVK